MRIPFAAAISLIIVGFFRLLGWLATDAPQALGLLFQAQPGATWFACMVPAVLGGMALWRLFKLLERPAMMLTLAQGASALAHHHKERRAAVQATACYAVSAVLLAMMKSGQPDVPALVTCSAVFVYCSFVISSALLVLAVSRVRKVTRYVERNPIFG
jgi:hypothetical protein